MIKFKDKTIKKLISKRQINNLNSIAFISSPLQMICLKELLFYKSINNLKVVIVNKNDYDDNVNQIKKVAENLQIHISNIFIHNKRLSYFKLFFKYALRKENILILGAYYNSVFYFLSKIINYKKLLFVDDGLETAFIGRLNVTNEFLTNKIFKWKYPSSRMHFSAFKDLDINYFSQNNFLFIKKRIKFKTINNSIFLLGSNFIESDMLTFDQYQYYIKKIKNRYSSKNIFYLPHRREDASNFSRYGIEILKPEVCFEVYLSLIESLPKCIIGFYSTALITSKIILSENDKVEIINVPIKFNENDDERKNIYNEVLIKNKIKNIF
ncbi:MAG: polysialyltransferase family glycosyltransferase [Flavobacteriaceae bacterium]|nr:polysialyltransferase family glycosyltransferase [Flavobacteriaceae bacterium]